MTDKEKKIAEIQGKLSNDYYFPAVRKDIEILLSELERMQKELEYQVKRNDEHREVNQKLREEREENGCVTALLEADILHLEGERNHFRKLYEHEKAISTAEIKRLDQEIERLQGRLFDEESTVEKLELIMNQRRLEREKLIKGLRRYAKDDTRGGLARSILTEIGVPVE